MKRTAYLIPAGDNWILEIDGDLHSLRNAIGADELITLSTEDGLARLDEHIEKMLDKPELVVVR
jgi:hypothetical protein